MAKSSGYYLDTSVFMEHIKMPLPQGRSWIDSNANGRRMASGYTIIELNKSIINIAIKLYDKVLELRDVPAAKISLSNSFGRTPTYLMILDALIEKSRASTYGNDYKMYLALLEQIVVDLQDRFHGLVASFNGQFLKSPLYKMRIYSKADFPNLAYEADSFKVKQHYSHWVDHNKQLGHALEYFAQKEKAKGKLIKIEDTLRSLTVVILEGNVVKDWTHMGDILIALNSPQNHKILAHDRLFQHLGPMLGKDSEYV